MNCTQIKIGCPDSSDCRCISAFEVVRLYPIVSKTNNGCECNEEIDGTPTLEIPDYEKIIVDNVLYVLVPCSGIADGNLTNQVWSIDAVVNRNTCGSDVIVTMDSNPYFALYGGVSYVSAYESEIELSFVNLQTDIDWDVEGDEIFIPVEFTVKGCGNESTYNVNFIIQRCCKNSGNGETLTLSIPYWITAGSESFFIQFSYNQLNNAIADAPDKICCLDIGELEILSSSLPEIFLDFVVIRNGLIYQIVISLDPEAEPTNNFFSLTARLCEQTFTISGSYLIVG